MKKPLWDLSPDELLNIKANVSLYEKIKSVSYFGIPITFILALVIFPEWDGSGRPGTGPENYFTIIGATGLIFSIALNFWARNNLKTIATSYSVTSNRDITEIINDTREARKAEIAKNYKKAITIWEKMGLLSRAAHLRTLMTENNTVKVDQTVIHGDQITKTEIKDSVLNRSNVGSRKSKSEELREAKSLFEEGLIDDDEFKQMKKEILGK